MILFVQVPDLYAAIERADDPELRDRPVIVGGDPRKRGTVTSASSRAREAGVSEGMGVREAMERCPEAALRSTRLRRYREVAAELRAILRRASDRLEPQGLDGAYLELQGSRDELEEAAELCVRVHSELGVPARAGVGETRFVAWLAAHHAGTDGVRRVDPAESLAFMAPLPLTEIWGLGPNTAEKLAASGLRAIGDLQPLAIEDLEAIVGRNAQRFLNLAKALDRDPLKPQPPPKSLSQEETLTAPTGDLRQLGERIGELAARLAAMLDREHRVARTVTLALRYLDDEAVTRTQTREDPIATAAALREIGLDLLSRTQAGIRSVRRLRLQVSNLGARSAPEDARQLSLF